MKKIKTTMTLIIITTKTIGFFSLRSQILHLTLSQIHSLLLLFFARAQWRAKWNEAEAGRGAAKGRRKCSRGERARKGKASGRKRDLRRYGRGIKGESEGQRGEGWKKEGKIKGREALGNAGHCCGGSMALAHDRSNYKYHIGTARSFDRGMTR